jgi:hypothetical protein
MKFELTQQKKIVDYAMDQVENDNSLHNQINLSLLVYEKINKQFIINYAIVVKSLLRFLLVLFLLQR